MTCPTIDGEPCEKELFAWSADGRGVTDTEKQTPVFIRRNVFFAEAVAAEFHRRFAAL
jgi:hypothetical protein